MASSDSNHSNLLLFAAHWRRPDLARLCFSNKVDANFTGCDGMTAPMFLYSTGRKSEAQTEFLEIMACNSFTEINRQDPCGWTVLHRAAAFGTREDIKALLALNLATHIGTYHLEWTALFCAVCHNNRDTMEELWSAYGNPHQMTDLRGWNLLHVAAGAGNFEVVDYLIQHGVSLDATSNATSRCVPPGLEDRRLTPSDVARVYGEESYRIWSSTLESCGRTANPQFESIDWSITEDEPHIAYGGCECCDDWGF
jgi:ankyrin repeat protein